MKDQIETDIYTAVRPQYQEDLESDVNTFRENILLIYILLK
jgi:hypothetical protein